MYGPGLLARFIEAQRIPDSYGNRWQYNSQSDSHSKAGCWGVAFDLLRESALLQRHGSAGKIVIGVNHSLTDFGTGSSKKLDLVVARPTGALSPSSLGFKGLAPRIGIQLTADEQRELAALPDVLVGDVGAVLMALEAKAVMTKHVGSLPRLYAELDSSHAVVHGASAQALAIAYVQINMATEFAPSTSNRFTINRQHPMVIRKNRQPHSTQRTLEHLEKLPRRSGTTGVGFDGIGVSVIDFENRPGVFGAVSLVTANPAPLPGQPFNYEAMIIRMANEYDSRFHGI